MALVYQQNINETTRLGLWHIEETEDFFRQRVFLQNSITHPHKRLQHLAGRFLLTELFPAFPLPLILVAGTKKPFLQDDAYHFSISHCGNYAAALVSTKNRVGVDVEIITPKTIILKHKFLSATEQNLLDNYGNDFYTIGWSIKEAMYKWYGLGKVDFIQDMNILTVSGDSAGFKAACYFGKNIKKNLNVQGSVREDVCIVWLVN